MKEQMQGDLTSLHTGFATAFRTVRHTLGQFRFWLSFHSLLRRLDLRREELQAIRIRKANVERNVNHPLTIFNLDLHISVNKDVEQALELVDVRTRIWSLSMHNHLVEGRRPVPDPVAIVNARTWRDLTPKRIQSFKRRYGHFLECFDGFVVTYPVAFAELFGGFNKPILVVAATRYEAPYTLDSKRWMQLNQFLKEGMKDGYILVVANNRADSDYFAYFTGVSIPVVPSLCDYGRQRWTGGSGRRVIIGRVPNLVKEVVHRTKCKFMPVSDLGSPYSWIDLLECEEVCVLPQNVSTMTLFELATAGVPVAVPSKKLMRSLVREHPELLGELTFAQMEARGTDNLNPGDPTNWTADSYLDWWLDRADFYDPELMPNVRVFESLADLMIGRSSAEIRGAHYRSDIFRRNQRVLEMRSALATKFRSLMAT